MDEEKNYCPHCNGEIMPGARKCKHCGEFLDKSLKEEKYAPRGQRAGGPPPSNGIAVASLILGILGIFICGLGIVAIILGFIGLSNAKKYPSRPGQGAATAGLILGFVGVLLMIAIIAAIAIPNLLSAKVAANEHSTISSLRTLSSAQQIYITKYGTFGDMSALVNRNLIAPVLARATDPQNAKNGYYYKVEVDGYNYSCTAMPAVPGTSGGRSFFMSSDGVIYESPCRSASDPPADENSSPLGGSSSGSRRSPW